MDDALLRVSFALLDEGSRLFGVVLAYGADAGDAGSERSELSSFRARWDRAIDDVYRDALKA